MQSWILIRLQRQRAKRRERRRRGGRTPDDTCHDFAFNEECQAFLASLTDEEKSGDGEAVGEARAEQAAEALLAELTIDSSGGAKSEMKCVQEGKNPGRKYLE